MPKYLIQEFTYAETVVKNGRVRAIDGRAHFWAEQTDQNQDRSNEFAKAARDWLVTTAKWPACRIRDGHFACNQPGHETGKELRWDDHGNNWVKE